MSRYDWLLFLHVLAAFAMVAATVLFWSVILATRSGPHPAAELLEKPANILVGIGSLLTLVFGIWLAIDLDAYDFWDAWILIALVLWVISVVAGQRSGPAFARAATGGPDAPAARRQGILLAGIATTSLFLVILDMFFKPWA